MPYFYRREVFQQALDIIWRKKYLWFLGFFAGLAAHGGEPDLLFRNTNSLRWLQDSVAILRDVVRGGQADQFLANLRLFFNNYTLNAVGYLAVLILILVVILWLVIVSQSAIVRVVGRASQKKQTSLFDGLATGTEKFWSLLTVNVVTKLFTWALWIIVAGIPAIAFFVTGQAAWAITFSLGSLLVTLPISIVVSFLTKYAIAAITLGGTDTIGGLRQAWKIFRDNWLVSIELAVLIYLFNLAVVLVVAGVTLLVVQTVTSFREFFTLLTVLAIVHSFVSAFSYAAWTTVYQKLLISKGESQLGYWTTKLTNFIQPKRSLG
ncbi:MAG: hypothetical protein HYY50_00330 [Candidatus Kerfeldbacteria bacterium]|nr:hypothetical protein [Candidatus Kerfeldbacteria bacterium]